MPFGSGIGFMANNKVIDPCPRCGHRSSSIVNAMYATLGDITHVALDRAITPDELQRITEALQSGDEDQEDQALDRLQGVNEKLDGVIEAIRSMDRSTTRQCSIGLIVAILLAGHSRRSKGPLSRSTA